MNDILRANLDSIVLGLLKQESDHGYNLLKRIRGVTGETISDGSLYPCLYRLEEAGKIEGTWETSAAGRERKVFRLTKKGRKALLKADSEWPIFQDAMNRLFGGTPDKPIADVGRGSLLVGNLRTPVAKP